MTNNQVDLGHAEVVFKEGKQIFESVRIIDGSILRTANLCKRWLTFGDRAGGIINDENKLLAVGEYDVSYHPAGSWLSITRLEHNGSLVCKKLSRFGDRPSWSDDGLFDKKVTYRKLGDCVTVAEAKTLVQQELSDIGIIEQEEVNDHLSQLLAWGNTHFIPLPIRKTELLKRWKARKRPTYGYFKSRGLTQPGWRQGVIFKLSVPAAPTSVRTPFTESLKESYPDSNNGTVVKLNPRGDST